MVVFVWLWPRIAEVIHDLQTSSRVYTLEKQRLELLKLRYEIEVIKKENELADLQEHTILPEIELSSSENGTTLESAPRQRLGFLTRFSYGASGAVLPISPNLVLFDWQIITLEFDLAVFLGLMVRIVVFMTLGGIGSAFIAKNSESRLLCFMVGLAITLMLSLLLVTGRSPSEAIPEVS